MTDTATTKFDMSRLSYSVQELAKITGLGEQSIRNAINDNRMAARWFGRKALVSPEEALRWWESLPPERP
ncbi:helix-turn-helix domain-containing protein [Frigoribacterium sp. VKM Ac-2530]|uniref:helix-turn-helix domain-containing protein n=1 Tax=Frigoribacterium sp. VKM Ac-2530 TaxID=2783822 RepID=UPI00188BFFC2|nr:helix-turn-helix domain-containing protein [Frigoribacterium sp. VKM Ac-2530]MBF4578913.1 helix-turn-helix domain-containing protein [Frigoribacterium sp. VKM Ac-2530]